MDRDAFLKLFQPVDQFLSSRGIDVDCRSGELLSDRKLTRAAKKLGFDLHPTVRWFYQTIGNGFLYSWESESHGYRSLFIPSLKDLIKDKRRIERVAHHWLNSPKEANLDPEIRSQFEKALHWAPLTDEGDGDSICWDLATGEIVYDDHDFFDTRDRPLINGRVAGETLIAFIIHWSRFCFSKPKDYWWGALVDHAETDLCWDPKYFHEDLVIS